MGKFEGRHGVTGVFQVPQDPAQVRGAEYTLAAYNWADTLFYTYFPTFSGISVRSTYTDHGGSKLLLSNGAHYVSGVDSGTYGLYITNRADLENVVPTTSAMVKNVVRDNSNRYKNNVQSTGSWNGTASQTYVVRISTPGIAGIAKCDVYGPEGQTMSQNNVINESGIITCSGNMGIQFLDNGPFYLNDSWAVRGVIGGVTQFAVNVGYEGAGYVDKVVLKFGGTGDQGTDLENEAAGTITVNSGLFGQPLSYNNDDFSYSQIGSNLHVAVFARKDNVEDYMRLSSLFIAMGDDDGEVAWP